MHIKLIMILILIIIVFCDICTGYCAFSHDVMAAVFVSQNNDTAAMFVSRTSPLVVDSFLM